MEKSGRREGIRPYKSHIFLCVDSCCREKESELIFDALSEALKRRGISNEIRISRCGCLDQCETGPILIIYPEGIWYHKLTKNDALRIVEEHIVNGNILSDLIYYRSFGLA